MTAATATETSGRFSNAGRRHYSPEHINTYGCTSESLKAYISVYRLHLYMNKTYVQSMYVRTRVGMCISVCASLHMYVCIKTFLNVVFI